MAGTVLAPSLDTLPRAGISDVLAGIRRYFRPGTARSPLRRLGDRFVIDLPGVPTLVMTCLPEDAKRASAGGSTRRSTGR